MRDDDGLAHDLVERPCPAARAASACSHDLPRENLYTERAFGDSKRASPVGLRARSSPRGVPPALWPAWVGPLGLGRIDPFSSRPHSDHHPRDRMGNGLAA